MIPLEIIKRIEDAYKKNTQKAIYIELLNARNEDGLKVYDANELKTAFIAARRQYGLAKTNLPRPNWRQRKANCLPKRVSINLTLEVGLHNELKSKVTSVSGFCSQIIEKYYKLELERKVAERRA